jgi:DNA-binding transcriptional LysR family regulator
MELRHLHYFVAVAEELHFSRAAERLQMAQPPLSQQIRQLETELGFQLFHRTKRSVKLTVAGDVFLAEVQQVLQQLQQAVQLGQQTSRGERGQLVIGFVSSAAYNILPMILRQFRTLVPDVKLELRELTTERQLELLQVGQIDIGFLRPPLEDTRLCSELVFRESLVIALPATHPLASHSAVALRSLATEPFILFPRGLAPGLYDPIISLCQQAGFSPTIAQEAMQMQTIVSLVAAEMGVAIVPASLQNLQRIGVVYKPLQDVTPEIAIAMVWCKQTSSPILEQFLNQVRTLGTMDE